MARMINYPDTGNGNDNNDEFCTFCNADLNKQRGYSNELNYWICKSCGTLLTNPNVPELDNESGIVWFCDNCEECLNIQMGFSEKHPVWKCLECGYENKIDPADIYETPEDYELDKDNPTRGMNDDDILRLSFYREMPEDRQQLLYSMTRSDTDGLRKIILVEDTESHNVFVKKTLEVYDEDIYRSLMEKPVIGIPKIREVFAGSNHLIVIEEFIEGNTLEKMVENSVFSCDKALGIMIDLCDIVDELHRFNPPIIHRDIKPANVMIDKSGNVILIDIDAAKRYKKNSKEDTVLLGTKEYAAPEQYGFGASSVRTDIYALGVLLNVLITGDTMKGKLVDGKIGEIISKCTKMDPEDRYEDVPSLKQELVSARDC